MGVDEFGGHGGGGEEVKVLLEDSIETTRIEGERVSERRKGREGESRGRELRTNSGLDLSMGTAISWIFLMAW